MTREEAVGAPPPSPKPPGAADFDLRGLLANSLMEWEDHIAAVAVAGGCPWRCAYCHGWRYVTGLADTPRLPMAALWDALDRHEGWLDGVVFSGGEPTAQPALEEALAEVKARGLAAKVHTNGTRPEAVERLFARGLVDTLALDYKAPLDGRLARAAGVPLDEAALGAVRESFRLARSAPAAVKVEYHTTLCPAAIAPADLADMPAAMAPAGDWFLQNYRPDDVLDPARAGAAAFDRGALDAIVKRAAAAHPGRVRFR